MKIRTVAPHLSASQFALQTAVKALEWESLVANAKSFFMPVSIGNDDELSKLIGERFGEVVKVSKNSDLALAGLS